MIRSTSNLALRTRSSRSQSSPPHLYLNLSVSIPSDKQSKNNIVSHTLVLCEMREIVYYILFRAPRNEGNYCETAKRYSNTFLGKHFTVKPYDFVSLCNINNFGGIETGGGCLGSFTTVFVDTPLWKAKHPRKRFQNFRQSCMLSTCRIEIHQSQPDNMTKRRSEGHTSGCDWWISIRSVDNR